MESRKVILLTEAYFSGRLDFKDKTSLSSIRELFVLQYIEKKMVADVEHLRCSLYASLAATSDPKVRGYAIESLRRSEEYALPYMFKADTINGKSGSFNKIPPEELATLKALLQQAKAAKKDD